MHSLGLVLSLPYGVLADRHGRKPFLYLSMLGLVMSEAWIRIVCMYNIECPLLCLANMSIRPVVKCHSPSNGLAIRIVPGHWWRRAGPNFHRLGHNRRCVF